MSHPELEYASPKTPRPPLSETHTELCTYLLYALAIYAVLHELVAGDPRPGRMSPADVQRLLLIFLIWPPALMQGFAFKRRRKAMGYIAVVFTSGAGVFLLFSTINFVNAFPLQPESWTIRSVILRASLLIAILHLFVTAFFTARWAYSLPAKPINH